MNAKDMKARAYRSQVFRTPVGVEKQMGFWIDRIGEAVHRGRPNPFRPRILGLYSAVYIERGEGIYISGKEKPVKVFPGDVMIVRPNIPTLYYSISEWKTRWITWTGPEADRLEKIGFLQRKVYQDSGESLNKAWAALMKIRNKGDVVSFLERMNIVLQMIIELSRTTEAGSSPSSETEMKINRIIEEMTRHPERDYTIRELSLQCAMSPTHFRRIFSRLAGTSPMDMLSSARISMAKRLLSEGSIIKDAAELSGFNDIFYFMRAFKKMTGITAGKFRSRHLR